MITSLHSTVTAAPLAAANRKTKPEPLTLDAGTSHFACLGTNAVHYVTLGRGKQTLVLIHCWAGNLGFWREQIPALADKARLVLIDLPGHGQSDKPRGEYSLGFFADAVLAVMREAKVEKATLIGHSMGAAVACVVCRKSPERVAAVASVDGLLRRLPGTPEQAKAFLDPFKTPHYREYTRKYFGSLFPVPGTEALRDKVLSEMVETPQYVMSGAMDALFSPDKADWDLKNVNVPMLVINAPSPFWPPGYEGYVRSLSQQTDYRVMPGVGHWLMLEKPAEFNTILTGMLRQFGLVDA